MENNRIQILKEILLDLHHGASPESVQERFNQHFRGVSALEISMMEHELMSSEDGVTFEDVMSLCNVHANLFMEEYLRFCAELTKIPKEQRTDQLTKVLALTHLEDMSARLIRNLSKGYRQRVGLAQAILGFPKIIILDEPTVGLDPKQVVEIRDLIRHLAKDHTVILSSHILSEIRAVCDRVLIIRKGRFVVCDTPEDLEEKLSAGGSLELTAKAAPEAAGAVLDRVAGITGRTLLGRTEDTARFAIHMERDIREALFFAFAEAGLPLLELRPRTASLEEVFLDLTDDNDTVAARAAALFQTSVETAEKEAVGDESDL